MKKILIVLIALITSCSQPTPLKSDWYWQKDKYGIVDSIYWQRIYYPNNKIEAKKMCIATGDTLTVLEEYRGVYLKRFKYIKTK